MAKKFEIITSGQLQIGDEAMNEEYTWTSVRDDLCNCKVNWDHWATQGWKFRREVKPPVKKSKPAELVLVPDEEEI